jgi:hypothetical protein
MWLFLGEDSKRDRRQEDNKQQTGVYYYNIYVCSAQWQPSKPDHVCAFCKCAMESAPLLDQSHGSIMSQFLRLHGLETIQISFIPMMWILYHPIKLSTLSSSIHVTSTYLIPIRPHWSRLSKSVSNNMSYIISSKLINMKETETTTGNPKHRDMRGRYIVKYARLSLDFMLVSYFFALFND